MNKLRNIDVVQRTYYVQTLSIIVSRDFMSSQYTKYDEVLLHSDQAEVLFVLEDMLETVIPDISDNSMGSFGYIHDNYNILELRLFQSYFQEKAQLAELPDNIGNLVELHTLDVSHNRLTSLPDTIKELEGLENFYLDYNDFTSIPTSLAKLENLRQLNFDENLLVNIPASIANSPYLQSLHLAGNLINRFPRELVDLSYLKRLVLNRNQISTLEYTILDEFSQLYVLDLRHNPIPEEQIDKALAYLKLSGKKRRKYYLSGLLSDWEHPYSTRNIDKRIRSDPLLELGNDDDKINNMVIRIKSAYDQRYQVTGKDEVLS